MAERKARSALAWRQFNIGAVLFSVGSRHLPSHSVGNGNNSGDYMAFCDNGNFSVRCCQSTRRQLKNHSKFSNMLTNFSVVQWFRWTSVIVFAIVPTIHWCFVFTCDSFKNFIIFGRGIMHKIADINPMVLTSSTHLVSEPLWCRWLFFRKLIFTFDSIFNCTHKK